MYSSSPNPVSTFHTFQAIQGQFGVFTLYTALYTHVAGAQESGLDLDGLDTTWVEKTGKAVAVCCSDVYVPVDIFNNDGYCGVVAALDMPKKACVTFRVPKEFVCVKQPDRGPAFDLYQQYCWPVVSSMCNPPIRGLML